MAQLVGQNCVRCGERIPSELEARICHACNSPVHDRCALNIGESGCPACGAEVSVPVATSHKVTNESSPTEGDPKSAASAPKNVTLAFTLNFFLPGSGLWYVGRPDLGLVNFVGVLSVGVLAVVMWPDRDHGAAAAACASTSGTIAVTYARQRNALGRANSNTPPVKSDEDEDWSD
jgi:hypothetical protein